ncbi:MAG: hypothetical protein R2792_06630 [Saprospiraceae bacterium]
MISNAQSGFLELCTVEFWQPNEGVSNWIRIKEDGLSGVELSGEISTVAWENTSGNITKKPVAYVSGSTARIGACFKKEGTPILEQASQGYLHFETLHYLGSKYGVLSINIDEVISGVWNHFSYLQIKDVDAPPKI